MRVLDLSHPLSPDMPVYPGTEPPSLNQATTIEADGFAEKLLRLYSHTGTHVDAPAHMIVGGETLDSLGVSAFAGKALVVDALGPGRIQLDSLLARADEIAKADFVLFRTLWSRRWGTPKYFVGFPVLDRDATQWLAGRGLKGVGFDAISADPVGSTGFENHLALFRAGMVIVENLRGLEELTSGNFIFSCMPLAITGGDGSPVRAVAIYQQSSRH
jgi:arylformamidase